MLVYVKYNDSAENERTTYKEAQCVSIVGKYLLVDRQSFPIDKIIRADLFKESFLANLINDGNVIDEWSFA